MLSIVTLSTSLVFNGVAPSAPARAVSPVMSTSGVKVVVPDK